MSAPPMSDAVATYLTAKPKTMHPVVHALRDFVWEIAPSTREALNSWDVPTFAAPESFAYWSVASKHVTFGFLWGTSLPDPYELLEGTGKNLRHVKIRHREDLQRPGLRALVEAAAAFRPPVAPQSGL